MSVNKILNYYILTHLLFILRVKGVMVRCNSFQTQVFSVRREVVSKASANFSKFPGEFCSLQLQFYRCLPENLKIFKLRILADVPGDDGCFFHAVNHQLVKNRFDDQSFATSL